MKLLSLPMLALGFAIGIGGCMPQPTEPTEGRAIHNAQLKSVVPNSYIVVLKSDVADAGIASVARNLAKTYGGTVRATWRRALRGFSVTMSSAAAARLARDPRVQRVEPDVVISARPIVQPGNTRKSQVTDWGVTRVGGSHDGTGRRAWIIDSGIDLDNPDLNVDSELSVSFVDGESSPEDLNGHGTHVAGILGAKDNAIGTVGVAANATLIAVRVLDKKGNGSVTSAIAGVEYVLNNASSGDVANMSFGGGLSFALDAAVLTLAEADVSIAIAAGNDGADCAFSSPARVNHENVFTVSAIDVNDHFAWFSNYGWGIVDYAAPGVEILSTKRGGGTTRMSGTSMATPHVAGLLALGSLNHDTRTAIGDDDGQQDPIAIY